MIPWKSFGEWLDAVLGMLQFLLLIGIIVWVMTAFLGARPRLDNWPYWVIGGSMLAGIPVLGFLRKRIPKSWF